MKSTVIWVVFGGIFMFSQSVTAWGGLFNRFSPEMLANMGFGSHGGGVHPFYQVSAAYILHRIYCALYFFLTHY